MLKKRGFWIILAAVILVGTGALTLISTKKPVQVQAMGTPSSQTAAAFIGSLTISASGTGTVIASEEASVGFYQAGTIGELLVNVGEEVEKGAVLARQSNTESLELAVTNAELQLALANTALQDIYGGYEADLADAELAAANTRIALEDAQEARIRLNYGRCDSDIVEQYYGAYVRAKESYEQLLQNKPSESVLSDAKSRLYAAEENYSYCVRPRAESEIAKADANVAVAQAASTAAQTQYEKLQAGVDEDQVAQAKADIAEAEYNLSVAQEALEGATVLAPIAGTVMSISANAGDTVEGSFITINQMKPTKLSISLDETDLNSIGVGYEVDVVFDAFEDKTFFGHVTLVYPGLTSMGNSGVVTAEVVLDDSGSEDSLTIPIGLSASVEVIGSRAANTILIPVEALIDLGDGQYAVDVVENGTQTRRQVEVGIMDFTYAEIRSGLKAGEIVSTAHTAAAGKETN